MTGKAREMTVEDAWRVIERVSDEVDLSVEQRQALKGPLNDFEAAIRADALAACYVCGHGQIAHDPGEFTAYPICLKCESERPELRSHTFTAWSSLPDRVREAERFKYDAQRHQADLQELFEVKAQLARQQEEIGRLREFVLRVEHYCNDPRLVREAAALTAGVSTPALGSIGVVGPFGSEKEGSSDGGGIGEAPASC